MFDSLRFAIVRSDWTMMDAIYLFSLFFSFHAVCRVEAFFSMHSGSVLSDFVVDTDMMMIYGDWLWPHVDDRICRKRQTG